MPEIAIYLPTRRLFIAGSLLLLLSLACFFWDWVSLIWLLGLVSLTIAIPVDAIRLSTCRMMGVSHQWDQQPTVQRPFRLTLKLLQAGASGIHYRIRAIESDVLVPKQSLAHVSTRPEGPLEASWEIMPKRRGAWTWPGAYVQYRSKSGLLEKWEPLPSVEIPVYPKLTIDLKNQLNPEFLMDLMGLKRNRQRRADHEFESLRPYLSGDNYRHIDWKASARMQTYITRQFQVEHHHHVLVCLDSSRMMGTMTYGISKLDWAIEATLHLAYLTARFQDQMGLLVFSDRIERWVKPRNNPVQTLLQMVYNLESTLVEADYYQVCQSILASQKKRSLVIFLSDFLDAGSLEPFLDAFAHLNRHHCGLFVGVEDPAYQRHLNTNIVQSALDITQGLVAQDAMGRRQTVLQELRRLGLRTITVSPENLVQQTMKVYLEVKFQGAI